MKAIVTGSFDPITLGHVDLVRYASKHFEKVYVVALNNESKSYMFNLEERKKIIEVSIAGIENAVADAYDGYTADYMHKHGIEKIVRGVRNDSDREYEDNLAKAMKSYDEKFETIFVNCTQEHKELSSTVARELIDNKVSLENVLHPDAITLIKMFKK